MKNLGDFKDLTVPLAGGMMDGRSAAGEPAPTDFRILLNVDTQDQAGRARAGGFTAWKSSDPSNEDLHDQLLGGAGKLVDGEFMSYAGQREIILLLSEACSSGGVYYSIAATKSRIYASTGQSKNWRIIADNLAGGYSAGDTAWPNVTVSMAQIGDYLLFTNNIDPVMAWPLGGSIIKNTDDPETAEEIAQDNQLWAAFQIFDLLGLDIDRAGVVSSWNGFAFIGNVIDTGTRYPSRVYWSDEGAPTSWAPGGNSLAGFVDLGGGETILRIDPIGGQLRVYTDKAIYSVTLIGGDAVFQFQEIYRGDLAVAFAKSFVNLGAQHLWMVQDSIVAIGPYDREPTRFEWMHRAAGWIFLGMDGSWLNGCPLPFSAFNALDKTRCYQIASGYDQELGNVWISWPTKKTDPNTPDDTSDFEGVRRMTMVLNPRYNKATLVDHGFSAFSVMRMHQWKTVRDFMVEQGVCTLDNLASDTALLDQKEGAPLNTLQVPGVLPLHIWNDTEDPTLPMSSDSVAAQVCGIKLALDCNKCVPEPMFSMASTTDFCIKRFDRDSRLREIYVPVNPPTYVPKNLATFPNVSVQGYTENGYPTLIQGEVGKWGTSVEKIVTRIQADYDAEAQTIPGRLCAQLGVTNSPRCVTWYDADSISLNCLNAGVGDDADDRPLEPAMFPFYRAGQWVAYRVFVASGDDAALNYAPTGCGLTMTNITIRAKSKSETWANQ